MKKLLFFCFLILLVSCHSKKNEAKLKIIPEDKFIKVLIDYHLAEGVSSTQLFHKRYNNCKAFNITDSVLHRYGYTKANFDSTVSFYSDDPEKFDAIYDKVIASLSRIQAEVQKKMAKEKDKSIPKK